MKIRNKKIKIIAIITILVITIIYGIWKENKGKIKIENINEQAEITDIEDNEKTKNLHNTTMKNNENIKNKETNKTDKTDKNKIVIYIIGEVKQEGVYELDENSRISDAIEKAGGTKENADLSQINLAYKIEDGMRIYIPKKGELVQDKEKIEDKTQEVVTGKSTDITNTTSVNTNLSTNKKSKTDIEKINLNKATQTELETLPGIGPSTAEKIIAYRKENGNFKNIEDIMNVNGIGESKYSKIRDLINV
ncbi:competence protein ComEA helix-hairpin-helix repeat protein [Clostridium sp. CAG:575]|nr:competence protein ComEA helix-hairpin-helix repeat protein [Clostridium sp. CAG:575]